MRGPRLVVNRARHRVRERAAPLRLIGTNAAAEGFGFDSRTSPPHWVVVPLEGLSLEDTLDQGASFVGLLERVRRDQHWEPAP